MQKQLESRTTRSKPKAQGSPNTNEERRLAARIKALAKAYAEKPGALLSILETVQDEDPYRYLSETSLRLVAEATGVSLARVFSVATFYSYFNLTPQGKHTIVVCRGTACYTRGSLALLQEAMARLGEPDFREEEEASFTTADRLFTVRTVACFGQCALAPVVAIDETIHSNVTTGQLSTLLETIKRKEGSV